MKKVVIKEGFRSNFACGPYTMVLLYTDEAYCGKGKEVGLSVFMRTLEDAISVKGLDYINENPGGKLYLIEDNKEIETLTEQEDF